MSAYDAIRLLLINLGMIGCSINLEGINFDRFAQCFTLTFVDLLGKSHTIKLNIKKYVKTEITYRNPKEAIVQLLKSFGVNATLMDGYLCIIDQKIAVHTDIKDTKSLVEAIERLLKAKNRKLHHFEGSDYFNQYKPVRVCIAYKFGGKYYMATFIYSPKYLATSRVDDPGIEAEIIKVLNFCSFDLVSIIDVTMSQEAVNHG